MRLGMLFCLLLATPFFSFPCAARGRLLSPAHGDLLSPQNFSPLKTLRMVTCSHLKTFLLSKRCVWSLLLSSQNSFPLHILREDMTLFCGVHACTVLCETLAAATLRSTTHVVWSLVSKGVRSRPLHAVRFWLSCLLCAAFFCCRGPLAGRTNPLSAVVCRDVCDPCDSCSRR